MPSNWRRSLAARSARGFRLGHRYQPMAPYKQQNENNMQDMSSLRNKLKDQYPRYQHWEKFKILEADLTTVSRYIKICEDNLKTHSFELSALILRACTDVEIIRKRMTEKNDNGRAAARLFELYPDIRDAEVFLPLWSLTFAPWKSLPDSKPDWWKAYEDIKHDNSTSTRAGNLEYFLKSLSGLYIILLYYDRFIYSYKDAADNDCIGFEYPSIESTFFKIKASNIRLDTSAWGNISVVIWDSSEFS